MEHAYVTSLHVKVHNSRLDVGAHLAHLARTYTSNSPCLYERVYIYGVGFFSTIARTYFENVCGMSLKRLTKLSRDQVHLTVNWKAAKVKVWEDVEYTFRTLKPFIRVDISSVQLDTLYRPDVLVFASSILVGDRLCLVSVNSDGGTLTSVNFYQKRIPEDVETSGLLNGDPRFSAQLIFRASVNVRLVDCRGLMEVDILRSIACRLLRVAPVVTAWKRLLQPETTKDVLKEIRRIVKTTIEEKGGVYESNKTQTR